MVEASPTSSQGSGATATSASGPTPASAASDATPSLASGRGTTSTDDGVVEKVVLEFGVHVPRASQQVRDIVIA